MTRSAAAAVLSALLVALPSLVVAAPVETGQQENVPKNPPKNEAKPAATSLTGCVDERDGKYLLTDDRDLTPIANLQADGFAQEGFAKHLGQKVTVKGTSIPGEPRPTFKVRSITTVSETCAPQRQ